MSAITVMEAYFGAFNKHDPEAVAALFAGGGKYVDSAVSSGVKGKALKDYLRGHYAAFPDARYRVVRSVDRCSPPNPGVQPTPASGRG